MFIYPFFFVFLVNFSSDDFTSYPINIQFVLCTVQNLILICLKILSDQFASNAIF